MRPLFTYAADVWESATKNRRDSVLHSAGVRVRRSAIRRFEIVAGSIRQNTTIQVSTVNRYILLSCLKVLVGTIVEGS